MGISLVAMLLLVFASGAAVADLPPDEPVDSFVTEAIEISDRALAGANEQDKKGAQEMSEKVKNTGISQGNSEVGGGAQQYLTQAKNLEDGKGVMSLALSGCLTKCQEQLDKANEAMKAAKETKCEESEDDDEDSDDGQSCADSKQAAIDAAQKAIDKAEANKAACTNGIAPKIAAVQTGVFTARQASKVAKGVSGVTRTAVTVKGCSQPGASGMRCWGSNGEVLVRPDGTGFQVLPGLVIKELGIVNVADSDFGKTGIDALLAKLPKTLGDGPAIHVAENLNLADFSDMNFGMGFDVSAQDAKLNDMISKNANLNIVAADTQGNVMVLNGRNPAQADSYVIVDTTGKIVKSGPISDLEHME